ncbi:MAG: glycosyltransferase family 39 protein [Abditibacteriota bacterium]|nr:glycosyltransferase family 39 protein [Abditibacteriota bacterium]
MKKRDVLIYALIALVGLIVGLKYAAATAIQRHEYATMGMCLRGFSYGEMIRCVITDDRCPVLYHTMLFGLMKVASGNIFVLRLISVIFAAVGVFFAGLLGGRLRNLTAGVMLASLTIVFTCARTYGIDVRVYALLTTLSIIALYMYTLRWENMGKESLRNQAWMGIVFGLLANTHYTGIVLIAALFIADVVLIAVKRSRPGALWSYIICFVMFIPWAICGVLMPILNKSAFLVNSAAEGAVRTRSIAKVWYKDKWLDMRITRMIILAGFAWLGFVLRDIMKKRSVGPRGVFIFLFVFFVVFVEFYTRRPQSNLGIRFFCPIFAVAFLACAEAGDRIIRGIFKNRVVAGVLTGPVCLFYLGFFMPRVMFIARDDAYDITAAGKALAAERDIENDDVLVYNAHRFLGADAYIRGWKDYYLSKRPKVKVAAAEEDADLTGINKVYLVRSELLRPDDKVMTTEANIAKDFTLTETRPLPYDSKNNRIEVYMRK